MTYCIEVTEVLKRRVYVESDCAENALAKVEDDYANCDIVLDSEDFVDNSFEVVE